MQWLWLSVSVLLTAAANLLLKGSSRLPGSETGGGAVATVIGMFLNPAFIGGALCLAAALVPYNLALRRLELSVAYPVMTTSVMLIVALASILIFRESVTPTKVLGIVAVIGGVALLSSGKG